MAIPDRSWCTYCEIAENLLKILLYRNVFLLLGFGNTNFEDAILEGGTDLVNVDALRQRHAFRETLELEFSLHRPPPFKLHCFMGLCLDYELVLGRGNLNVVLLY